MQPPSQVICAGCRLCRRNGSRTWIRTYRSPDGIRVKALEVNRDGNRELAGAMYNLAAMLEGENPPREEILRRLDRDSRNDRRG